MTGQNNSRSGIERRSRESADKDKIPYTGPERRSGNERRVWVDRMQEINMKLK